MFASLKLKFHLVLLSSMLLSACDFVDWRTGNSSEQVIQGSAIKGVLSSAIVSAYHYQEAPLSPELIDIQRSNTAGRFQFAISDAQRQDPRPILIQVSADENTRMICDLSAGCTDQTTNAWVGYGEQVQLNDDFQLLGLAVQNASGEIEANISAISHLVVATALNLPNGLSRNNIETAKAWVADSFNLNNDPLLVSSIDVSNPTSIESASNDSLTSSILSASFLELSQSDAWINAETTINTIPLTDILETASALADSLEGLLSENQLASAQAIQAHASSLSDENGQLSIRSMPEDMSVNEGESFYFRVGANSSNPISYRWFKNGTELNTNNPIYGKSSASLSDSGNYQVIVSDGQQSIYSSAVSLWVNEISTPLAITSQPESKTLVAGENLVLSVTLNQTEAAVQWQRNGSLIPNSNGNTLLLSNVQPEDAGQYRAVISFQNSLLYSHFANVTITNGASPVSLLEQPDSLTLVSGQTATFSVEAFGDGYLRYQWYKDGSAISAATTKQLIIENISASDQAAYHVTVSNSTGAISSNRASLTVLSDALSLEFIEQPQSSSLFVGDSTVLSVRASNVTNYSYQWYKDGLAIHGANSASYSIDTATLDDTGTYYAELTSQLGILVSNSALISVEEKASLALSWAMPTERENGEPLTPSEIYGYRLEFGDSASNLDQSIDIVGANNTQYTLNDLRPGSVFLRIATIDSDGVTGRFSATIEVDLP